MVEVLRRMKLRLCDCIDFKSCSGYDHQELDEAQFNMVEVLRRTRLKLCDGTTLQLHMGMQQLRTTWAACLRMVEVLRRMVKKLQTWSASQQSREIQSPLKR